MAEIDMLCMIEELYNNVTTMLKFEHDLQKIHYLKIYELYYMFSEHNALLHTLGK